MTLVTETRRTAEFLLSEAPGYRSRETITIDSSQTLKAGQVLGRKTTGSATVTAGSVVSGTNGTPGNGAIGTVTADALAMEGDWKQVFIEPTTNLGTFQVVRPDGVIDGTGVVGTAYNGGINFTQADGSADFVAGDIRTINVAYATGNLRYVKHDPEGTDGSQIVAGILFADVTTGAGETAKGVRIRSDAEVKSALLVWDDHDAGEKTAAIAALATLGIIARS